MSAAQDYSFRRAAPDDLALLAEWQARPHVRAWWSREAPFTVADLADPLVSRWIVSVDGRPFAFLQDYTVHGWPEHHFRHLPRGSRGIDQFIGEPAMLGLGHGTAFIGARLQALFDAGAPVIATDPHPANDRAIAVYRKLGFEPSGPPEETPWGLVLPMLATRPATGPRP
ncbi:GNAT family N-acetyltransferase [Poseidonocella sp. HB161398]|uniref:GNAT family N-acetyltransferase n=1 Tax=Poseidonocella sp. HB161398 TaxID=2320855 RepID=UPI001108C8F7|nr:GNAT family N-acetyltransferase [Poseidonocella sp. HB161398]